jgi:hypothetical protein
VNAFIAATALTVFGGMFTWINAAPTPSHPERGPLDPFGLSPAVQTSSRLDFSGLIDHCRLGEAYLNQYNKFETPCQIDLNGLEIEFDQYYLDSTARVVGLAAMEADISKAERIRKRLDNQGGVVSSYGHVCAQFGRNTFPELVIVSKDQCEALTYKLI